MARSQEEIHDKGFRLGERRSSYQPIEDYSKIKIGSQTIEEAILNLGYLNNVNKKLGNKQLILKALAGKDLPMLREISNYFYRTNGIYYKVCNTYSTFYRYDWLIEPEVLKENVKEEKILEEFTTTLNFLEESHIQRTCNTITGEVIRNGAYYGYLVDSQDRVSLQQLPINYCRSRYFGRGDIPAVEFNMKFFDEQFKSPEVRLKMLDMFPKEFKRGYVLYKQGKLPSEDSYSSCGSWYMLELGRAIKFSFNNDDIPIFTNAIPEIIDLDAAQDLDRRKQMQQLLKIIIQKLPLDKNGDLIFDLDEAADIHGNAVDMLKSAIGVKVLTTFADIDVADMSDNNSTSATDALERVERAVYNALGISQNLFNTDGNLSLEKSISNDAGLIRDLKMQLSDFFKLITAAQAKKKKDFYFKFYMLDTTQYNYIDLSKLYKEQTQIGFSKMLPQIALGHSQSFIINTAHFENEVLHLSELMLPPLQSSTLNAEGLQALSSGNSGNGKTGRPKKEETEKSDKTLANEKAIG